jgi:hypothetical protein
MYRGFFSKTGGESSSGSGDRSNRPSKNFVRVFLFFLLDLENLLEERNSMFASSGSIPYQPHVSIMDIWIPKALASTFSEELKRILPNFLYRKKFKSELEMKAVGGYTLFRPDQEKSGHVVKKYNMRNRKSITDIRICVYTVIIDVAIKYNYLPPRTTWSSGIVRDYKSSDNTDYKMWSLDGVTLLYASPFYFGSGVIEPHISLCSVDHIRDEDIRTKVLDMSDRADLSEIISEEGFTPIDKVIPTHLVVSVNYLKNKAYFPLT